MSAPRLTLEAEASFLLLVAKRILNFKRNAEKAGEVYNDLSQPVPLKCGVKVKMVFETTPSGYQPVITIREESSITLAIATQVATELMGAPVRYRGSNDGLLEFERTT